MREREREKETTLHNRFRTCESTHVLVLYALGCAFLISPPSACARIITAAPALQQPATLTCRGQVPLTRYYCEMNPVKEFQSRTFWRQLCSRTTSTATNLVVPQINDGLYKGDPVLPPASPNSKSQVPHRLASYRLTFYQLLPPQSSALSVKGPCRWLVQRACRFQGCAPSPSDTS